MGKTPAGIMIRSLTAADLTAVSSIDEKSFFDVWSPSMWLDELNNSLTRCWAYSWLCWVLVGGR